MIRKSAEYARGRAIDVLRYLSSEVTGLHAAAYILALSAFFSSLLALLRDRLLAHVFGASATLDIYYASFRIPDVIFVATGALVSVYMLIPELVKRNDDEQKKYIDTILVGFSVFAAAVSLIAALGAPIFLQIIFPEYALEGYLPTLTHLTRIMLLQPFFLGISNVLAGITQAKERYTLYAISPLLYNIGIIIGIVVFYPLFGLAGLAWGVVLGAVLHAGIQLPSILADGFLTRMPKLHDMKALIHTAALSVPRALALSMSQLAFLGLIAIAGILAHGSIAIFIFAYNLAAVPLAVIGASYSVAAFPTLALARARGETASFVRHVAIAARYVFFWSIPASALILVLRAHVVRVILGSGAFNWNDTRLTAAAFALISLSLAAQGIMLLLVRGYYAAGRTFMPFLISALVAAGTLIIAIAGLFLVHDERLLSAMEHTLRVNDIPGSNMLILPAAYAIATILGAIAMIWHFDRRFGGLFVQIFRSILESCIAALAGGIGTYLFLSLVSSLVFSYTALSIFVQGFSAGLCGIVVTALTYYLLDNIEFKDIYASLHTRFWRLRHGRIITTSAEGPGTPTNA